MGGYFVVNGLEKLIRLLIVNRRNYVMGIARPSFQKRGNFYTNFGTQIRCVRPDQSAQTVTVHYLSDGDCTVRFSFRKREYMIPAVLVFKVPIPLKFVSYFWQPIELSFPFPSPTGIDANQRQDHL